MPSIHDQLARVRKPRVHITYEVETEGAMVQRELPFVVGVLGDFSGDAPVSSKPLKERKFIQIDRDNFNDIMSKIEPKLNLKVENTLAGDGSEIALELTFKNMEDFEPGKVVDQIEPLKKLLAARNRLRDLLTKADRSEQLEALLEHVLSDEAALASLSNDLGLAAPAEPAPADPATAPSN